MKKFCTKCGHEFEAVGREVICPSCKEQAAADAKRAAVLKAKRASWTGESVPVRISGRASTVIREYGAAKSLPFAEALDTLLMASAFFKASGKAWEDVTPYKSRRRDKATSTAHDVPQEVKQDTPRDVQASKPHEVPQEVKQVTQAAKKASKASTASKAKKAASVKKG